MGYKDREPGIPFCNQSMIVASHVLKDVARNGNRAGIATISSHTSLLPNAILQVGKGGFNPDQLAQAWQRVLDNAQVRARKVGPFDGQEHHVHYMRGATYGREPNDGQNGSIEQVMDAIESSRSWENWRIPRGGRLTSRRIGWVENAVWKGTSEVLNQGIGAVEALVVVAFPQIVEELVGTELRGVAVLGAQMIGEAPQSSLWTMLIDRMSKKAKNEQSLNSERVVVERSQATGGEGLLIGVSCVDQRIDVNRVMQSVATTLSVGYTTK